MFFNFPVSWTRPEKIVWFESHASQVGLHHRYPWSNKQQNRYCISKYYHLPSTVKRESFSHMFIFQTRQSPSQLCRQDQMKMFHLEHETMNVCQRNVERFVQMECRFDKIKDIFQGFGSLVSLWLQKDGGAKSKQIWMNLSHWNTGSWSFRCEESLIFFILYANIQLVKHDIVITVIYYYTVTEFHYAKRDLPFNSAYGGVRIEVNYF